MKRDIWATITFLITGLLFYLAQTSASSACFPPEGDPAYGETVMVGAPAPRASENLLSERALRRES